MNSGTARELLLSGTAQERREAARWLAENASSSDRVFLQAALTRHPDHWVLTALNEALGRLDAHRSVTSFETPPVAELDPELAAADAYARGVRDTTQTLVHELRRFVGFAKLSAGEDAPLYESSQLRDDLERLSSLLDVIEELGTAASAPAMEEFDLAELLVEVASREATEFDLQVDRIGRRPLMVIGDPKRIEVAARSGLRNACEAVREAGMDEPRPIVVAWGRTDRDAWFTVIDEGPGPPPGLLDPFEFAATTKDENDHFGVGLALSRRAIASMSGTVRLDQAEQRGARFAVRWPIQNSA